jgi:hypothetical protein
MGDLDDDYIEVNDDSELIVQDDSKGELPFDAGLEANIVAADVRVHFTYEEQLIYNRHLTPVSTTTETTSVNYEEQDLAQEAKYVVGYDKKLHFVAVNLECMYNERALCEVD